MSRSHHAQVVLVALATGLLVACGSGSPSIPATSDPVGRPVASPAGSSNPDEGWTIRDLPESVLKPIPGFSYAEAPGPVVLPAMVSQASVWEGSIVRSIFDGTVYVGGMQLLKLRGERPADPGEVRVYAVRDAMKPFTGEQELASVTIAGQAVLTAEDVLGTERDIAGWFDGRDLVLISGAEEFSGSQLAFGYLTGRMPLRAPKG